PHANMEEFQAMLKEAGVRVVTGRRLKSVQHDGPRIVSLTTDDDVIHDGKQFIDASYEGDLMARAGVSYIVGREGREQYDEALAGFTPMPVRPRTDEVMGSACVCVGGTGPHYIHGTPTAISAKDDQGRLIFGVNESQSKPGQADRLTQSYNFRVVVTKRPEIRLPFPKPVHYDATHFELLRRLIKTFPMVAFGRLVHLGEIANGKFDLNAQGLFSTDYPGANFDYPDGDETTRARIWQAHVDYVQGFLWFLSHDEQVPQTLRDEVNEWGLCSDEFVDNDHWPYALYVRDGRRMIGEDVMVQQDMQQNIHKPDSVGMGSFVIDCHIVQRIVTPEGNVTDEGSFQDAPTKPYQIPYRSLTPKKTECINLLVPVCLSASHIACCSLRMEPVYMSLGQASGVAASMAMKAETAVQNVNVAALQTRLREQKAVLELKSAVSASSFEGIVQDDEQAVFNGTWTASSFGDPIEGSARHDGNTAKGSLTAVFTIKVPADGSYEVRMAYPAATNRASNVPVLVEHEKGSAAVAVNEKEVPVLDKRFVSLGTYRFSTAKSAVITISNAGTDGFVAIDAVQLLPVK
ncbi:MAG: FAD-dependent oxidoreductase, partial [Verrucomicrobiaceae bacterium]|nr:FAD-dependent oxidoreductase [Verrucomicrobiaceae bacterium]